MVRRWLYGLTGLFAGLALAAGGLQILYHPGGLAGAYADWFRDGMRGPYGSAPAAFPGTVPAALRVALRDHEDSAALLVDGAILFTGMDHDSHEVDAVDLRTGRRYWTEIRSGPVLMWSTLDAADHVLYQAWGSGDRVTSVERVDVRRGRVVWRRGLRAGADGIGVLWTGHGTLALEDGTDVRGLDPKTGRVLWTTPVGASCWLPAGAEWVTAVAGMDLVFTYCGPGRPTSAVLLGIDPATGAVRWRLPGTIPYDEKGPAVSPEQSQGMPYLGDGRVVVGDVIVDPATGRRTAAPGIKGSYTEYTPAGGGQVLTLCPGHQGSRCRLDPVTGRVAWRADPPAGSTFDGRARLDGGLVYVAVDDHQYGHGRLAVLNAATGRTQTVLTVPTGSRVSDLEDAAGGVVQTDSGELDVLVPR